MNRYLKQSPAFLHAVDWPAPKNVRAFYTTRVAGASTAPYDSFNLGANCGDTAAAVESNRQALKNALPDAAQLHWLQQVHGGEVARVAEDTAEQPAADAWYCERSRQALCILTADCLPVLFCSEDGRQLAAAHAGWRGLAAGVLLQALKNFNRENIKVLAWLGPAISQACYEVDAAVYDEFHKMNSDYDAFFRPNSRKDGHFFADLAGIARWQLQRAGVQVFDSALCTFSDQAFYSYRRTAITGRQASLIYCV